MYKQILIILIVIVSIILCDIIMQSNTKNTVNKVGQQLNLLRNKLISNENDLNKEINDIINMWKKEYKKLAYYIEHNELEKVETELTKLRADIEVNEYSTGVENLDNCIFILNHIKDKNSFKIVNIF